MPEQGTATWMRDCVCAPLLAFALVIGGWFALGEPWPMLARLAWPNGPAPWERVTAVYVPDLRSPEHSLVSPGYPDLHGCRVWVHGQAVRHGDRRMARGDWRCMVVAEIGGEPRLHLK